jgi:peptidoglycan/LPS O-acetylase OafA/YrhL
MRVSCHAANLLSAGSIRATKEYAMPVSLRAWLRTLRHSATVAKLAARIGGTPAPYSKRKPHAVAVVNNLTTAHYLQLDGLRGLAILLVIVYHFSLQHPVFQGHGAGYGSGALLQLAHAGWMGVDLFFVLSGFLITGILVETRTNQHYFRNFLARRFLRIWPLYYLTLIIFIVVLPRVLASPPVALIRMQHQQAWFWLYGANWLMAREGGFNETSGGYYWSLAVEEQFYLVWPLVVYKLSNQALLRTSMTLLAAALVSRLVLGFLGVGSGPLYTMTFTHWDGLAVGSALAICLRSPQLTAQVRRIAPWAAIAALLGVLGVRLADGDFFLWGRAMGLFGYTFVAVAFGALLFYALERNPQAGFRGPLATRFMTQSGKLSYALYLVHVPVSRTLAPIVFARLQRLAPILGAEGMFLTFAVAAFAVSWFAALASWHLFEKHVLALKRYFNYG